MDFLANDDSPLLGFELAPVDIKPGSFNGLTIISAFLGVSFLESLLVKFVSPVCISGSLNEGTY